MHVNIYTGYVQERKKCKRREKKIGMSTVSVGSDPIDDFADVGAVSALKTAVSQTD